MLSIMILVATNQQTGCFPFASATPEAAETVFTPVTAVGERSCPPTVGGIVPVILPKTNRSRPAACDVKRPQTATNPTTTSNT